MDTATLETSSLPPTRTTVLVVGGGPCGLMLANELGRREVPLLLVNDKPHTAMNPQANATQARTMEHYRRLGFAEAIRSMGLPADFPTDIAYFTRYAGHELARFSLPSAAKARTTIRQLSGSWSAAELPHRVSQKFVEVVLHREALKHPSNALFYGWRLLSFTQHNTGVSAELERVTDGVRHTVEADFLVGADGPRSTVRRELGIRYEGETGVVRDFMGGRMFAVYVRCPSFYQKVPHPPAWMNVTFNAERRAFMATVDGHGEFAFHTQLHPHESEEDITDDDAKAMFCAAVGTALDDVEILSTGFWTAGHSLVAERLQEGRVFIGGDAAHLFTPAGGLGYNTAVEDAVNLAWKLAAVTSGQAPFSLLASYDLERRPAAVRNTGYAKTFADSLGNYRAPAHIEDDTPQGEAARAEAGEYFDRHGRLEFNIPGVTFGTRYDGSPIVVDDGTQAPPDVPNEYQPTAKPGGRPPHAWLTHEQSLYDVFGRDWTLLALNAKPSSIQPIVEAAEARGVNLTLVQPEAANELLTLYEAELTLIRPDQMVAWRGQAAPDAEALWNHVLGGPSSPM